MIKRLTIAGLFLVLLFACKPDEAYKWDPDWGGGSGGGEETTTAKPRFVWIDAAANFDDYANSRDKIREDCLKIAQTGFTEIVVDVRPTTGDVLFHSSVAPALTRIDVWRGSNYVWAQRTATFDYLQAFIEEGHAAGLKVNASINTLVGGYQCPYGLGRQGMLFSDTSKQDWATVQNREGGLVSCLNDPDYGARFLNPAKKEVQDFVLTLIAELAAYEGLDGIVLDRCRYDDSGLMSDFSEASRTAFAQYCGQNIAPRPSDIFAPGTSSLGNSVTQLQRKWLAFRAKTIHDLVEKAAKKAHEVNPDIRFGAYVGAWYSTYYTSGVNWASPRYNCQKDYSWAGAEYQAAGFADHLDFLFLGAYAGTDSIYGSTEWTMEGFCSLGRAKAMGETLCVGGPDIGNASGFEHGGKGSLMPEIVKTCIRNSDGLFVFDLCHIKMYNYWSSLKTGIDAYLKTVK